MTPSASSPMPLRMFSSVSVPTPTSAIFPFKPKSLQAFTKRGERPPVWQAYTPSTSFFSEVR